MQYYSTRDTKKLKSTSLRDAVLQGLAPDGGLYLPERIEPLPQGFFEAIESLTFDEINTTVVKQLVGDDLVAAQRDSLVVEALNFALPIVHLHDDLYVQELFHGPTMAFKDVGARFMARLMAKFAEGSGKELNVIVATSGDTGSAVAAGFFNVPGIRVYILYPKGKVSPLQEKQLTTWGGNITAIEVDGTFDDCQRMAKQALSDTTLQGQRTFTSANSINIARLIPQSLYYFHAYRMLKHTGKPLAVSIPSGNFGNLTGGLIAQRLGLPISHFVAATNANDIVPEYLATAHFNPRPSVATISNAMDVGNPSNFERLLNFFENDHNLMSKAIKGYAFSDSETKTAMREVFNRTGYTLDPHGAVGYLGLREELKTGKFTGVLLETAHPVKFIEVVEETLTTKIEIPEKMQVFARKEKMAISCENAYEKLRDLLF